MDERDNLTADEHETINANETLSQFWGTAKDVIARYTHCAHCGANLHFSHVTNFTQNLTQETARCPECGIKIRQIVHRLQ